MIGNPRFGTGTWATAINPLIHRRRQIRGIPSNEYRFEDSKEDACEDIPHDLPVDKAQYRCKDERVGNTGDFHIAATHFYLSFVIEAEFEHQVEPNSTEAHGVLLSERDDL